MDDHYLEPIRSAGFVAQFIGRIAGVSVDTDRDATLARLLPFHKKAVEGCGLKWAQCWRAEQVHGNAVAIVDSTEAEIVEGVDGLVTNTLGVALGIYVADCGAVYLVDPVKRAIGLVHSGEKGSEQEIVRVAIEKMADAYGTDPADLIVSLAPCILPPAYEIDFARQIEASARNAGVTQFFDCGICTSSALERYYSYRIEKGATGRMLAILGIQD